MNNIKLHYYQKDLLKKFALSGEPLRFNDLLIEGLESEHMNYHLQKLIEIAFVVKNQGKYELTDQGKDYSNLMDDKIEEIEKQPKTSVLVIVARVNPDTGKEEFLMTKRLRQPYFGKVGFITGKVRFGEKLDEAVSRELFEETGLKAETIKLIGVFHKLRTRDDLTVQDVLFYRFFAEGVTGTLIQKTIHQENFWSTAEDIMQRTDRFDTFILSPIKEYENCNALSFTENKAVAQDF